MIMAMHRGICYEHAEHGMHGKRNAQSQKGIMPCNCRFGPRGGSGGKRDDAANPAVLKRCTMMQ